MRNITIPFQITKVDEDQRRVWGVATSEALDSQGDVLDYQASKKAVTDWMKVGNIREMHDGSKAVGKAFNAEFDDAGKSITVGAYISRSADGENTWTKVKEGILTGYSVGGKVLNSAVDKAKDAASGVETTINRVTDWAMSELSLVDNPANPTAQIVMVKSADGKKVDYIDMVAFKKALDKHLAKALPKNSVGLPVAWWVDKYQNTDMTKEAQREYKVNQISKMEKRDYSDDTRQDMADAGKALPDGSFPIANKTDLANAIKAVGRAKDPAKAKAHIITRAKALKATDLLPDSWNAKAQGAEMTKKQQAAKLRKDFMGVATLVDCAMQLTWFQQGEIEEGDTDTASAVQDALDAIKQASVSELNELDDEDIVVMANAIAAGKKAMDVKKAGINVIHGDPRDANGNTVADGAASIAAVEGGTPVARTVTHKDNTKVTTTKGSGTSDTITPAPVPAKRKTNPAADDPEAVDTEDADEAVEVETPTGDDTNDGGSTADDTPENAEPAAAVQDDANPTDNITTGHSDGQADGPSEETPVTTSGASGIEGDADTDSTADDDVDEQDNKGKKKPTKSSNPEFTKLANDVSNLTDQLKDLSKSQEMQKSIVDIGELLKKVATQQSGFEKRLDDIEKRPSRTIQTTGQKPFSSAYPAHEVVKGQEGKVEDAPSVSNGHLSQTEIVELLKTVHSYERNPALASPDKVGEVFRKLWKITPEERAEAEKLIK